MNRIIIMICVALSLFLANAANAYSRYFHGGDGTLNIRSGKSGAAFSGPYRDADGNYIKAALDRINRAYGAPSGMMEPRFIEFLDYLQDAMHGGTISIHSGYRSPTYNTSLRAGGKLAGKASMHQYGMAADIRMKGVPSEKIWHFVRDLGYGGAGYYHGANAHVDVGPARFWDETSSKVDTDHADDNKLITLIPDRDIYRPGEEMRMRFVRMTAYPIGVDMSFALERKKGEEWASAATFAATHAKAAGNPCPQFANIAELSGFRWAIPASTAAGRYRIRAAFCNKQWEAMPDSVTSYEFVIEER